MLQALPGWSVDKLRSLGSWQPSPMPREMQMTAPPQQPAAPKPGQHSLTQCPHGLQLEGQSLLLVCVLRSAGCRLGTCKPGSGAHTGLARGKLVECVMHQHIQHSGPAPSYGAATGLAG